MIHNYLISLRNILTVQRKICPSKGTFGFGPPVYMYTATGGKGQIPRDVDVCVSGGGGVGGGGYGGGGGRCFLQSTIPDTYLPMCVKII